MIRRNIRRIAALALLGLICSVAVWAASSFTQTLADGTECLGASTCLSGFGSGNTAGGTIVVIVRVSATGRTVTVADSKGNTYTGAGGDVSATGTGTGTLYIFHASNVAAGANSVTVTASGAATNFRQNIIEYGGLATSSSLDASNSNTALASTSVTTGAATCAAGDVVVVGASIAADGSPFTIGAPWNSRGNTSNAGFGVVGLAIAEDQINVAGGSYNGAITLNSAQNWAAAIACFKVPVSGGAAGKTAGPSRIAGPSRAN